MPPMDNGLSLAQAMLPTTPTPLSSGLPHCPLASDPGGEGPGACQALPRAGALGAGHPAGKVRSSSGWWLKLPHKPHTWEVRG